MSSLKNLSKDELIDLVNKEVDFIMDEHRKEHGMHDSKISKQKVKKEK